MFGESALLHGHSIGTHLNIKKTNIHVKTFFCHSNLTDV